MTERARILIAEDEAIIRLDLREMLEEEGYEVVGEAGDGQVALKLAEDLRPDLSILDIVMPGMDGLTVAAHINSKELSAVLILTAFSQRELVEKATRTGAMAYLVKPFEKHDLMPAVELAMARWTEVRALAGESRNLAERLEARKLVEKAKGIIMSQHRLTEQDSFRMIQKMAMEQRTTMATVAKELIAKHD